MKPISAAAAAKRAAEAQEAAAAVAAEEAEAKRRADELKRTRALRDRKLHIALMRAAVERKTELIWRDDQANLSQLCHRGFWIYEQGVFGWLDVWRRLREWHLHYLESVAVKWSEDVVYEIRLTDTKALRKLFGGIEGFSRLHRPFLKTLFNELKKESSPVSDLHSSMYHDVFEKVLFRCLQSTLREAISVEDIEPELAGWTFWQYDEVYGGQFIGELQSESHRLASCLRSQLIDSGSPIIHLDEFQYVKMEGLSNLRFDPKGRWGASPVEGSLPIFQEVRIIGSTDNEEKRFKGGILHPAIVQYYSEQAGDIKYEELYGVKSLKFSWVRGKSAWRPLANNVDERLLNWLGGSEGQTLFGCVFGLIESAALGGKSMIKLALVKGAQFWILNGEQDKSLRSLPPVLLQMLLSSYGYDTQLKSEEKAQEIIVTW
jgi:hypothetical protein